MVEQDFDLVGKRGAKPRPARIFSGRRAQILGMAALLLLIVAIPTAGFLEMVMAQRSLKRAWDIRGPACPLAEGPIAAVSERRPLKSFDYGGARFVRRSGHVSCVAPFVGNIPGGDVFHVCQFSGPDLLAVTTSAGDFAFRPGVGRRATVTVRDGRASCVVGGWFGR